MTVFEDDIQRRLRAVRRKLIKSDTGRSTESAEGELVEIDAALLRLAQGRFGLCEECGRALGRQRLLADPTAVLCFSCLQRSR